MYDMVWYGMVWYGTIPYLPYYALWCKLVLVGVMQRATAECHAHTILEKCIRIKHHTPFAFFVKIPAFSTSLPYMLL